MDEILVFLQDATPAVLLDGSSSLTTLLPFLSPDEGKEGNFSQDTTLLIDGKNHSAHRNRIMPRNSTDSSITTNASKKIMNSWRGIYKESALVMSNP